MIRNSGRKLLGVLFALAMVIALMPGLGLTAYADGAKAYAAYDVTTEANKTKSGDALAALQVTFNGHPWYIIEDNSTSATEGKVTLLAADTSFGLSIFAPAGTSCDYYDSTVRDVLVALSEPGHPFEDAADAIESYAGGKLYLLSTDEAEKLSSEVLKMIFSCKGGSWWWLRTEGFDIEYATYVEGHNGEVYPYGYSIDMEYGIRPALKLDLSKVIFSSELKSFALKPHTHSFTYSASGATITAICGAQGYCVLPKIDGKHAATLSIVAPRHAVYGDGKDPEATIIDENNLRGDADVKYYKAIRNGSVYTRTGSALSAAPTDAGDYMAEITLGEWRNKATASLGYTVEGIDPIAVAPKGVTAIIGKTLADVKLNNPSGNTEGAWTWADPTASVGSLGKHTFKANFTPENTRVYRSVNDVDITVTVNKAANPTTVTGAAAVKSHGNTIDLAENVALNGATGAVSYEIVGESHGCKLNGSKLTSGKKYGSVTVNVTVAEDAKHYALAATPITVTVWTDYPVWVGGTQVTSINMKNVFGDGKVRFTPASDTRPATLKLDGYRYSGEGVRDERLHAAILAEDNGLLKGKPLNIVLEGVNSITCTGREKYNTYYDIHVFGSLTFDGTGSLTVDGKSFAIDASNLIFNGSGIIRAKSEYIAIFATHDLTVNRGIVTAEAKSDGIDNAAFHAGQIVVKGSGGIRADAEGPRSVGLYNDTADGITVKAGNVLVNASGEGALGIKAVGKVAIGDKIGSFIAAGTRMAISGEVVNDIIGSGWNDAEGTGENENITPSSEGQALGYKRIQFPGGLTYTRWMGVSDAIKALPEPVTLADKDAVAAVRAAYDALSNAGKMMVSPELVEKLINAEATIAAEEAKTQTISISECTITAKDRVYTGEFITPRVTVMYGETRLKKDRDYTLSWKKAKSYQKVQVTVKGKGKFKGARKVYFRIIPKGTAITKVKAGNRQITLKWKKQKKITGYMIEYSLKKDFSEHRRLHVKGAGNLTATIRKLETGSTYYVRVRTYAVRNDKRFYSAWSKAKAVKTNSAMSNDPHVIEIPMNAGEALDLKALIPSANSWENTDESIVTVSEEGVVTALTAGDVTVTVLDSNGEATAVRIHVSDDGILGLSDLELSEIDDVIEVESPAQQEIVMGSDLDVTIE